MLMMMKELAVLSNRIIVQVPVPNPERYRWIRRIPTTIKYKNRVYINYISFLCIICILLTHSIFITSSKMELYFCIFPIVLVCIPTVYETQFYDVIMGAMASQITSLAVVYSTVYSGGYHRKHQGPASLACVWGIHLSPVNSPYKWSVTRKMFPFDDVIMERDEQGAREKRVYCLIWYFVSVTRHNYDIYIYMLYM